MSSLSCRLVCAANSAYGIAAPTGVFTPPEPQYTGAGFKTIPTVVTGGPEEIDAALVGLTDDGVVVAFRGTLSPALSVPSVEDWIEDLLAEPKQVPGLPGKVHSGFYDDVSTLYDRAASEVKRLVAANPTAKLYCTGHSKGGPLASLFAMLLHVREPSLPTAEVITWASARTGDSAFKAGYEAVITQTSYENYLDLVPFVPPPTSVIELLEKVPWLGSLFTGAEKWDYVPLGDRKYIEATGEVTDDTDGLDVLRVGEIVLAFADGNYKKVIAAHCIACEGSGCAGGYMTGGCGTAICCDA